VLDEVGVVCVILNDLTRNAQAVRVHRNNLVHARIDDHAATMTFADARAALLTYLHELPKSWG
jgi:hypothetical protein